MRLHNVLRVATVTLVSVALVAVGLVGTRLSALADDEDASSSTETTATQTTQSDTTTTETTPSETPSPEATPASNNTDAIFAAVASQIAQLDAEAASLAQKYAQSEIALEQARQSQTELSEAIAQQESVISQLQIGIMHLVNTQRQDPGFGAAVNFVVAESPDQFISSMATMNSVETILEEQAFRFRSEQGRLSDLNLQLAALVDTIEEQVTLQKQLIAAQEARSASARAALMSLTASQLSQLGGSGGTQGDILPLSYPNTGKLTSTFGWRDSPSPGYHSGNDYASYCGAPIWAAASGIVVRAGWSSWYGEYVEIDHGRVAGDYFRTGYAHMSYFIVSAGQAVQRGQIIGFEGDTGESYGCHLHFNVIINGRNADSRFYM
ncbi:MAG: M23 family metallopeptidase [Propionibacteriaceae bacterium]|jgi:murein DD-endopeptidase MepM/ murein hydrolase activator NlpD|nr:M23 family metallopeptidase [Propionibacteriaceae bacterium]